VYVIVLFFFVSEMLILILFPLPDLDFIRVLYRLTLLLFSSVVSFITL